MCTQAQYNVWGESKNSRVWLGEHNAGKGFGYK